jgi:hypothetical protein
LEGFTSRSSEVIILQNDKQKDLNEVKKDYLDTINLFVACKIRVKRTPEQETDYRVFKIHMEDAVRNALLAVGDVRFVTVIS